MTRAKVIWLVVAAVLLIARAVDHRQRVLRQHGEPGADLRAVRAVDQHDARLRRHGLARACRLSRHRRLYLHPADRRGLRSAARRDPRGRAVDRRGGVLRRAVAARAGPRLHHDHARARPDRLGRRLSGERPHRRRQRHPPSGAADAVRHRYPRRAELLLFHAHRLPDRAVLHLAVFALAVRREPDGHARPAAPHAHARPQCLAHPVDHVRHGRLLGLGRQHPLRLLQPVPQPARDLAAAVGRDPADGDPRRRELAHRPDRRRRDHHAGQERGLDLRGALEHAARRDLRDRRSCSCRTASCRAASSCGGASRTAASRRRKAPPRSRPHDRAGARSLASQQALRRPAGDARRLAHRDAGRAPPDHRAERRRQDHAVQPGHRRSHRRQRLGQAVRAGTARDADADSACISGSRAPTRSSRCFRASG